MKKFSLILLTAALLLLPFTPVQAWSSFRNESGLEHANTTNAKTPASAFAAGVKWQIKFAEDSTTACNSDPVITDTYIYVVCKNILYQLDKKGSVCSTLTLAASMNSVCRMCLSENRLFIPLGGGRMQCVEIPSMTPLWTGEAFGNQSLTTAYYANGCVYAGTTNAQGKDGMYYCLSVKDGSTLWTYRDAEHPGGYYWSGAISNHSIPEPSPANNSLANFSMVEPAPASAPGVRYVLFGGDNGILVSHSDTDDTVYDTFDLSTCDSRPDTGRQPEIRAGITYDAHTDAYYTTSNDGYLYQIKMNADGTFGSVASVSLCNSHTAETNCTSTPTVYNGRIYVCAFDGFHGQVCVADAAPMRLLYSASSPDCRDIKSSPLVCTGYATPENHQRVCVYFTQNTPPGGIYFITDQKTSQSAEIQTLFLPDEGKQFCLSSVAADTDGTLYYSNDSGTLFAVHYRHDGPADSLPTALPTESQFPLTPAPVTTPLTPAPVTTPPPAAPAGTPLPPTPVTTLPPTATPSGSVTAPPATQSPKPVSHAGKPHRIRWTVRKKKKNTYRITFSWKKGSGTSYTKIIIRQKTKDRKQKRLIYQSPSTKKTVTLKKGTYRISFTGCRPGAKKSGAVTRTLRLSS